MNPNRLSWLLPTFVCAACCAADAEAIGDGAAELRRKALETMSDAISFRVEAQWETVINGVRKTSTWTVDVRKARGQCWPTALREELRSAESWSLRVPGKTYHETSDDKLLIEDNREPEFFGSVNQILGFFAALQEPRADQKRERLPDVILNGEECAVFRVDGILAHHAKSDGCPRLIEWPDVTLRIQRVEFNTPIDPARFEFHPPDGTRIEVQAPIKPNPFAPKPRKGQRGWTPSTDEPPPPRKAVRPIEDF